MGKNKNIQLPRLIQRKGKSFINSIDLDYYVYKAIIKLSKEFKFDENALGSWSELMKLDVTHSINLNVNRIRKKNGINMEDMKSMFLVII